MKKKRPIVFVMVICVVAAMLVMGGRYFAARKIAPGSVPAADDATAIPKKTVSVAQETITEWHEAVGTVRPQTEARIEAQITAKVRDVHVTPGSQVTKEDLLITLDDRQSISRLDQARQAEVQARAVLKRAQADYDRTRTYYESQAATAQDMERAQEALTSARAGIRRAAEVVREARIAVGYTEIRAPEAGEVLQRLVDPGDLALPGKPLLVLRTSGEYRLEAYVREGLIKSIRKGDALQVTIDALEQTVDATVEEILPYADPATRTFLVKAAMPAVSGLYPGMYGKLLIPVRDIKVVMMPRAALRTVGQLELVTVRQPEGWQTRFVKTGLRHGDRIEVLAGLDGGEILALQE
jgi:RND family efflux transporter MFP subunit